MHVLAAKLRHFNIESSPSMVRIGWKCCKLDVIPKVQTEVQQALEAVHSARHIGPNRFTRGPERSEAPRCFWPTADLGDSQYQDGNQLEHHTEVQNKHDIWGVNSFLLAVNNGNDNVSFVDLA